SPGYSSRRSTVGTGEASLSGRSSWADGRRRRCDRPDTRDRAEYPRPVGTGALLGRAGRRGAGGVVSRLGHAGAAAARTAAVVPGRRQRRRGAGWRALRRAGHRPRGRPRAGHGPRRNLHRRARLPPAGHGRAGGAVARLPGPRWPPVLPGDPLTAWPPVTHQSWGRLSMTPVAAAVARPTWSRSFWSA